MQVETIGISAADIMTIAMVTITTTFWVAAEWKVAHNARPAAANLLRRRHPHSIGHGTDKQRRHRSISGPLIRCHRFSSATSSPSISKRMKSHR